jgi:hypothetical protein
MYVNGSGQYTVENCYATGTVSSTASTAGSAVGIVGRAWDNAGTIIQHNVALQTNLQGSASNTVAILGSNVNTGTKENYSNSAMLLNGVVKTDESAKNGTAVSLADAKTEAFYTTAPLAWDFDNIWEIEEGYFPILKWESGVNTSVESPKFVNNSLSVSASNGILTIKGLVAGELVRVYTVTGTTIYDQTAKNSEQTVRLPAYGVYVIVAGNKAVKVIAGK